MDCQEDADSSVPRAVPRARTIFQTPLPLRKRPRTTPTKSRSSPQRKIATPRKPRSKPRQPRHRPETTTPPACTVADTPESRRSRQTIDTSETRVCPAGRAFPFPKASQRVKAYWQFIVGVADDEHASVPRGNLKRNHAKSFYCLRCNKELQIQKGKSIVGPHMQKYHRDEVNAFEEKERRQKELERSRNLRNTFVPAGTSEQSVFNSILAEWVSGDMRPVSIVGDRGLAKAIRFANNAKTQLSIPSRQTVAEGVHVMADEYRLSLRDRLGEENECNFFSASSDIWTSLKTESFISLTIHYVDAEFNMHAWTLEVAEIPGKHDGDAIAAALKRFFSWWRLDPKRCVIFLRDGASNMKNACSELGLRHMSCAAHSLHLVVGGALLQKGKERNCTVDDGASNDNHENGKRNAPDLGAFVDASTPPDVILQQSRWMEDPLEINKDIGDADRGDSQWESSEWISDADIYDLCDEVAAFVGAVEKLSSDKVSSDDMESVRQTVRTFRKISAYFHQSQKGTNRLEKLQSEQKNPLSMLIDCPTRWNSTLKMLQRFVDLKSAIQRFFFYLGTFDGKKEFSDGPTKKLNFPSSEQWFTIQCLIELLAPFSIATESLGAESYPTLVSLYCVVSSLKVMLGNENIFDELYASVATEDFAMGVLAKMQSVRMSFLTLMETRFDTKADEELIWISLFDPYTTNSELFAGNSFCKAKNRLLEEMIRVKEAVAESPRTHQPSFPSPESTPQNAEDRFRRQFLQLRYSGRVRSQPEATNGEDVKKACETELWNYFDRSSEAKVDKNAKIAPSLLAWWKEHHNELPILAPLARKWLGCIATSVPSERAFSTAGNIITKRRTALKANSVRDLIFMAQNTNLS